jgi:hypothetical protein
MTDADRRLANFIDALAIANEVTIAEEHHASVAAHVETAQRMAEQLDGAGLADHVLEQAPVFLPGSRD